MSENTFTKIYEVVKKFQRDKLQLMVKLQGLLAIKGGQGLLIEMEMCLKHLYLVARTDNWLI